MVVEAAELFRQYHGGVAPSAIVAERDALVAVVAVEGRLGLKKIPVRVVDALDKTKLAKPGMGRSLALFLMDLPDGRISAGVTEYNE